MMAEVFMRKSLVAAVVLGAAALTCVPMMQVTRAAPEPSIVPTSWQLNFKHGPIERLNAKVNGKDQTYYFMRYNVTNNSGKDILFTPEFELVTDTGQVTTAFKDVPNEITAKIKELYKNNFMQSPTEIVGKLRQGEDNSKDGVIVFTGIDPDARDYQIYISGLSGETAEVTNPVTKKPTVLQKTLLLDYMMPGQAIGIDPKPTLKTSKWVMK
jgi:hypothetical protein